MRNNNARLTAALQESASNVDEWNRQLQMYKDENSRLRAQVSLHCPVLYILTPPAMPKGFPGATSGRLA